MTTTWTTVEERIVWTATEDPSYQFVTLRPTSVTLTGGGGGGGVALGETSSTAYRGDRGKTAYDHSQVVTGNPHGTTAADVGAQPADSDLTTIAGLTPTTDSFMQAKAGAWAARTIAQVKTDLGVVSPEWTVIAERDISSTSAAERFDSTTSADPTSYKELRLSIVGQCVDTASSQTQIGLRLNNDTASGQYLWAETGRGGGANTQSQDSGTSFYLGKLSSQLTNSTRSGLINVCVTAISTSWRHSIRSDFAQENSNSTNSTHYLVGMLGGAHMGTGAITRVDVFPLSGTGFAAGSRIRLMGRA